MLGVRGRWKSENNFCRDICSKNVSLTKKLQKIGKKLNTERLVSRSFI